MTRTSVATYIIGSLLLWWAQPRACDANELQAPDARTTQAVEINRRWAAAAFSADELPQSTAHRLLLVHEDHPGDTKIGRCAFGTPLRLGDTTYTRGIGVNSHSVLRLLTSQPMTRFKADIGLDRNVDHTAASVTMLVRAHDRELFATPVLRPNAQVQTVDLDVEGATSLDLVVTDGGDGRGWDQANWANARVVLQDGTELWLDDLARQSAPRSGPPFSFVYGGRPSSELLPQWTRETQQQAMDGSQTRTVLTFTDPETRLQVRAVVTTYLDTPGVDWTLYFANGGPHPTPLLEQVKALDTTISLGLGATPLAHRLRGSICADDDWMALHDELPVGTRLEFGAVNGRSSADSPFFTLQWGDAGVVTAVGWSGQWRGAIEHIAPRELRVDAGMERLRVSLQPGETIRTPRIMQLYWSGHDADQAHNLFRQTMLSHIVPRRGDGTAVPPIVHLSTSFHELNESNEANVLSHLHAIRDLGFEMFWLDAYWTRDGFPAGMGHYGFPIERVEPRDRFPRGIAPIRDAVRDAGLEYLMWFEPERVHPGTLLAKEHPEWVISPSGDGSGLYNLGIPTARELMTRYLAAAIEEYGLDCLRIDFNIDPLPFWEHVNAQDPDRMGMAEIRYVEGLYRMWDDLRTMYPRLLIDNCASGGRRIDLETCSRSLPLWRSDNTCDMVGADPARIAHAAIKNQVMSHGLNRYVPLSTVGQMGTSPYLFRSGFNGGIALADDCRGAEFPREQLRQAIAEAKRIRPYWFGDFYPLSAPTLDPSAWCVLQYHRAAENDGIVLFFRRDRSPYAGYDAHLRAIDVDAIYEIRLSNDYKPSSAVTIAGRDLQQYRAMIDPCPGSLILEYRRL